MVMYNTHMNTDKLNLNLENLDLGFWAKEKVNDSSRDYWAHELIALELLNGEELEKAFSVESSRNRMKLFDEAGKFIRV